MQPLCTPTTAQAVKQLLISLMLLIPGLLSCSAYHPTKTRMGTPSQVGLSHEEVFITTSDQKKLHAWYVPSKNHKGVILYSHGNGGNISYRLDTLKIFHSLGYFTLIYDYRGYGKSSGTTTEKGTYRDIAAVWRYLVTIRRVVPSDIIIFGRSLGGGVASWLAAQHKPRAVILESTFTSVPDLASDMFWWLPSRYFTKQNYNTWKRVHKITSPLLIVHSKTDDLIPYKHGKKNFKRAKAPKSFLTIQGTHNGAVSKSLKKYKAGLRRFLKQYEQ